jgi:hypothetical protein
MSILHHRRQFNAQCSQTGRKVTIHAFSAAHALREAKKLNTLFAPLVWPVCYNADSWYDYLRALKQAENGAFHEQKLMLAQMADSLPQNSTQEQH